MWKASKIIGLSEKLCNLQMCLIEVKSGDSRLDGGLINFCRRKGGVIIECPNTLGEEEPQNRSSCSLIRVEKMIDQVTEELPSPSQFLLCVLPEPKPADIHGFADYKMKRQGSLLPTLPPPLPAVIPPHVSPGKLDAPKGITTRPGFGGYGRQIPLQTDTFKVSISNPDGISYQYNVSIDGPDFQSKAIGRRIADKLYQTYGEKIWYLLLATLELMMVQEDAYSKRSGSPSDGSPSEPSKRSKCAARIPLESISFTLHFQDALRLLDIIFRQQAANRVCVLAAQSLFCDNSRNLTEVGVGVTGCAELHYNFHPPHGGLSLYMDVTKTVILTLGGEVNFLIANQNIQDESHVDWDKVKVMLNMRVQTMLKKMEFKIIGLREKPCNLQMCFIKVKSGDSRLDGGLTNCCRRKGLIIECPHTLGDEEPQYRMPYSLIRVEKMIEQVTEELPSPSQFLLFVLPEQKPADIHGSWKKKSLSDVGIVYQCISPSVINDQYLWNMLLRMNTKIGGTNSLPLEMEVSRGTDCESLMSLGPRKLPITGGAHFVTLNLLPLGLVGAGSVLVTLGLVAAGSVLVNVLNSASEFNSLLAEANIHFSVHRQLAYNNVGASCYANVVLQALRSLHALKIELLSIERPRPFTRNLQCILFPRRAVALVDTRTLFKALKGVNRYQENSPSSFLEETMKELGKEHPSVVGLFGGRRESRRNFVCGYKTTIVKRYRYLYLRSLVDRESTSAALHRLFHKTDPVFKKFCELCGRDHRGEEVECYCSVKWRLTEAPKILFIELQYRDPQRPNRVSYDDVITLQDWIFIKSGSRTRRSARYKLKAVIQCVQDLVRGEYRNHFIAYVSRVVDGEDCWLKTSDHVVEMSSMREVFSLDSPRHLFYELIAT